MMVVVWRFIGVFSCRFFDFIRLYLVDYRGITSFFFDCFLENNNYSCIFAPDNNYK